jgi:hypothetical protein
LLIRSSGFVDHVFRQWVLGNDAKASTSAFASSMSGPIFGNDAVRRSRTSSGRPGFVLRRRIAILAPHGAEIVSSGVALAPESAAMTLDQHDPAGDQRARDFDVAHLAMTE